jgi:U3 small nucleolar RNA-associated protein 7
MKQNPQNAIIGIGDQRGVVSMYSPNCTQPLVKILSHKSSVLSLAFHNDGNYMATTGNDGLLKVKISNQ